MAHVSGTAPCCNHVQARVAVFERLVGCPKVKATVRVGVVSRPWLYEWVRWRLKEQSECYQWGDGTLFNAGDATAAHVDACVQAPREVNKLYDPGCCLTRNNVCELAFGVLSGGITGGV